MEVFKYCIVLMLAVRMSNCRGFLENLENSDVNVVKMRLQEEKEKRLLLENDVEMMMIKLARLERQLAGENTGMFNKTWVCSLKRWYVP